MAYPNARDCEHGHKRGSCDLCNLLEADAEIERLRAALKEARSALPQTGLWTELTGAHHEIKQLRAEVERLNTAADRAIEALAHEREQGNALRANLQSCRNKLKESGRGKLIEEIKRLSAEVEALRAMKKCSVTGCGMYEGKDMATLRAEGDVMQKWRPIKTAPKDRSVLLLCAGQYIPVYCGRLRFGGYGEPQQNLMRWRCDSSGRYAEPTHWLPIPAHADVRREEE